MRRAGHVTRQVIAIIAMVCAAIAAQPLADSLGAQVITGTVRDRATHAALPGVTVAVADGSNTLVRVAITSATGQFSAAMTVAGTYTLQIRRIGYAELTTSPAPLRLGDTVIVAIELAPAPVTLDTVKSKDRPDGDFLTRVTPGHEVFAKHYALGKGIFVDGAALERSGMTLTDYLGHESGVRRSATMPRGVPVVPGANGEFLVSNLKSQCLYARVDHWSLVRLLINQFAANIDELVPSSDIMGVEFYRDISEVPVEWTADADLAEVWTRSYSLTYDYAGNCGGDRYWIGSTDLIDGKQARIEDTAFSCSHPQRQGYAASPGEPRVNSNQPRGTQQSPGALSALSPMEMPKCGFMQVWTKRSW